MTVRSIYPVVMCGGVGTRLWPASQPSRPKQFLRLTGAHTMFQQTMLRVTALATARPIVIGNIQHADAIESQLADIGVEATVLLEPCVRDSAPAIAAAVVAIAQEDPDAIAVVVASDHYIPDEAAFRDAVLEAAEAAKSGQIVTLGVRATHASTAYGYIKPRIAAGAVVLPVEAFVEKPGPAKAADYLDAGYLWNSGNFIFAIDTMLNEFDRHAPLVADAAKRSVRDGEREGHVLRLAASFETAPKISLDYAVMEKTDCAAVLPVDFFWSDLGAWNAVHDACNKDTTSNAASGDCTLVNSERCFVRNETHVPLAAIGVSDLAIIAEPSGILVCELSASQAVKSVAEKLSTGGRGRTTQSGVEALSDWALRYQQWLMTSALPLWWTLGADHESGGFHELLDQDGMAGAAPRRARVQTRQSFVYAEAAGLGWQGPSREAAVHGMRYFRAHYLRDDGLFRTVVDSR
ncbi:MAG TPA: sugar phosphate nucleotidyltransferase, partial [Rhizomicrobium sp.]|nr:sugar phosphate nucleotidyltransferase [Rhizomicrobium sp.]